MGNKQGVMKKIFLIFLILFLFWTYTAVAEEDLSSRELRVSEEKDLVSFLLQQNIIEQRIDRVDIQFSSIGPVDVNHFEVQKENLPFEEAKQVITRRATDDPWGAQARWDAEEYVRQGDLIFARLWLRTRDQEQPPVTDLMIKRASDMAETLQVGRQVPLSGEWHPFYYYAQMPETTDQWWLEFHIGHYPQEFDVGGVEVINLGSDFDPARLPRTRGMIGYSGREEEAEWRQQARERINQHRREKLTFEVVNSKGEPVSETEINVSQKTHAFPFGTAVVAEKIVRQGADNDRYREILAEKFNIAVFENDLKPPAWEGRWGSGFRPEFVHRALDWLDEHNIKTRGHTLYWGDHAHALTDENMSEKEMIELIEGHITDRLQALRGRLAGWDVHNHPLMFTEVTETIGQDQLLEFWDLAQELDPEARRAVNEGAILTHPHSLLDGYYDHITWLQKENAPLEAIGFMGHFSAGSITPPAQIIDILDKFAEFDLPLMITEFDMEVNTDDREEIELRTDYVRDFLTAVFSHPAVDMFLNWGFWAGQHWLPEAAFYDRDWNLRPHGEVFFDLIYDKWWTEKTVMTDENGTAEISGFKGDYEVEIIAGKTSKKMHINLESATTIRLEI